MPELPEVEVTRRRIEPRLVGRRIARVDTTGPSYFFLTPPRQLRERLVGRRIESLFRRGKYLLADLDVGSRLLLHLGMTGQLFSSDARSPRFLSAPSFPSSSSSSSSSHSGRDCRRRLTGFAVPVPMRWPADPLRRR